VLTSSDFNGDPEHTNHQPVRKMTNTATGLFGAPSLTSHFGIHHNAKHILSKLQGRSLQLVELLSAQPEGAVTLPSKRPEHHYKFKNWAHWGSRYQAWMNFAKRWMAWVEGQKIAHPS